MDLVGLVLFVEETNFMSTLLVWYQLWQLWKQQFRTFYDSHFLLSKTVQCCTVLYLCCLGSAHIQTIPHAHTRLVTCTLVCFTPMHALSTQHAWFVFAFRPHVGYSIEVWDLCKVYLCILLTLRFGIPMKFVGFFVVGNLGNCIKFSEKPLEISQRNFIMDQYEALWKMKLLVGL